MVFKSVLHARL
ncbi:unnamed protein product, partial [Allacma fusca]